MSAIARKAAICDANVLIDFVKADEGVLAMLAGDWEQVFVPDVVLSEVQQLSATRAGSLGLTIIPTPLDLPKAPGLSYQDRACLHFAVSEGWVCIANDRRSAHRVSEVRRRNCVGTGDAFASRSLRSACRTTRKTRRDEIHADNAQITKRVIEDFLRELGGTTGP